MLSTCLEGRLFGGASFGSSLERCGTGQDPKNSETGMVRTVLVERYMVYLMSTCFFLKRRIWGGEIGCRVQQNLGKARGGGVFVLIHQECSDAPLVETDFNCK